MKLGKLNEDDIEMRKAIVINEGNLTKSAEYLEWSYWKVVNKLRAKKHRLWWKAKKAKFVRERKRARERRWYKNSKKRISESEKNRID